jgi:GNAT superfamily N-acetyltransferase
MTIAVKIRHGQPGDALGLAVVHLEAWQSGYRTLISTEALEQLSLSAREELWQVALTERQHPDLRRQIDVAVVANEIVGFCAAGTAPPHSPNTTTGEIYAIYVRPAVWSNGIGQNLISVATDYLRDIDMKVGQLWMVKGNVRAQHFYERSGWARDGRERMVSLDGLRDYQLPMNEICFTKSLYPS